jgi:hypothetical protein
LGSLLLERDLSNVKHDDPARPTDPADVEAAIQAAADGLKADPWLHDQKALEKALLHNLMCMGGVEIDEDGTHHFTGEEAGMSGKVWLPADDGSWDPVNWPSLIERANGQNVYEARMAHEALIEIAQRLHDSDKPLPAALRGYVVTAARIPRAFGRGRKPASIHRDEAIFRAIEKIVQRGFSPTRSPASNHESACSIVYTALSDIGLSLAEGTIAEIWERRCKARRAAGFRVREK